MKTGSRRGEFFADPVRGSQKPLYFVTIKPLWTVWDSSERATAAMVSTIKM